MRCRGCQGIFHVPHHTAREAGVAERLLSGGDYTSRFHDWFHAYPMAGYGGTFFRWALHRETEPYGSWGNGSAMRVSPVGMLAESVADACAEAEASAAATHNHAEGIHGAQATAVAIHLARAGHDKAAIRRQVQERFGYQLDQSLAEIRETYRFDVSCQGSVPRSIIAFLESDDYEDAIRNAISLGGDADTMACIAGGIAEAFYGGRARTDPRQSHGPPRRPAAERGRSFLCKARQRMSRSPRRVGQSDWRCQGQKT